MSGFPWHRVFHPLCGADLATLAGLVRRNGPPSLAGTPAFAIACASAVARLPFTALEIALTPLLPAGRVPPVFIVGHPRSGTTHLHNLMAASGAFATVPPVLAALPWERLTLAPLLRPFIDPYLPRTRLIDGVALTHDAPTEDEVGLANSAALSYFHALYFPRHFAAGYRAGLLGEADAPRRRSRARALRRYVVAQGRRDSRPLLLKNPAYTAQVGTLLDTFPGARIVHIHRDPRAVFASTRRSVAAVLCELALQDWGHVDVDAAVLDSYPAVMAALRAQTSTLPRHVFAELAYEDLVADPVPVLTALWTRLDLPGARAAQAGIARYRTTIRNYTRAPARLTDGETRILRHHWAPELATYGRLSAAESG